MDCLAKKIVGPNNKWWIDEEGNMYLAGNLIIEGGLDPTFFTCVSQFSITTPNTVGVETNVLKYRDNVGTEQNVNLGDTTSEPADVARDHSDTNVRQSLSGADEDLMVDVSITLSSSSNKALVLAGYVWGANTDEITGMRLRRGTTSVTTSSTLLAETVDDNTLASANGTQGGGGAMHLDSPASTATRTYGMFVTKDSPNINNTFGGSIAVIEVTSASS